MLRSWGGRGGGVDDEEWLVSKKESKQDGRQRKKRAFDVVFPSSSSISVVSPKKGEVTRLAPSRIDTPVAISNPSATVPASPPLVIIGPDTATRTAAAIDAGTRTLACESDGAWAKDHTASPRATMARP